MEFKNFLKIFLALILILLIFFAFYGNSFYDLSFEPKNYNFSLSSGEMQFYPNLRYSDSKISYSIEDCPLQRKADMENAFLMLSNLTKLSFYTRENPEIMIYCSDIQRTQENLFIAGEGGPINITSAGKFNVISKGRILLLKQSDCSFSNIALHELLHALGFTHSLNKRNLMYNVTNCNQQIGEDVIQKINELYATPSLPDLTVEKGSLFYLNNYLNMSFNVFNNGLSTSTPFVVKVYNGNKEIKEYSVDSLRPGYGNVITITNIYLEKVEKIKLSIEYSGQELDKNNNEIYLN